MAITWTTVITPIDTSKFTASISATRVDSANPTNPRTYVVALARIQTVSEGDAVAEELWAKFQADEAFAVSTSVFVTNREAILKADLEGRE